MFGYVIPNKNELKIREFEVYNSYYCAVCHSIRDRYGQIPRLLLTYDSVFLSMILSSEKNEKDNIEQFRCMTHPAKERNIAKITDEIEYAADMMILLGYYNLRDDFEDEKSVLGFIGSKYLDRSFKKIEMKYPLKSELIGKYLKNLAGIEKKGSEIFDEASEPFSMIMEEIFDYEGIPDENIPIYRAIGFHLGKWIYLLDAFDDIEKDIKKKNYNPIVKQFGFNACENAGESMEDFKNRTNERIRLNLELYLANIGEQASKLPLRKNREIIENIIYLGLLGRTDEVLRGETGQNENNKL